jgi:hypothetical protein
VIGVNDKPLMGSSRPPTGKIFSQTAKTICRINPSQKIGMANAMTFKRRIP